jgi:hypothetical protein
LILLLELTDVSKLGPESVIDEFKLVVDELIAEFDKDQGSSVSLKTVNLPVEVHPGLVKEIQDKKEWGYTFKVDTFGDYKKEKFSI